MSLRKSGQQHDNAGKVAPVFIAERCDKTGTAMRVRIALQARRGSRPHRSGDAKTEGVKPDKMMALETKRSVDELALVVPGAPSYDPIVRVSAFEPR